MEAGSVGAATGVRTCRALSPALPPRMSDDDDHLISAAEGMVELQGVPVVLKLDRVGGTPLVLELGKPFEPRGGTGTMHKAARAAGIRFSNAVVRLRAGRERVPPRFGSVQTG